MRGRRRHSVAAMSGLFLDVSWRCCASVGRRAAQARKHHAIDWRKMRTIEFSAGESLGENVPAGIVLLLTWLLLVRSPEAGFYFWSLLPIRVVYFDRAAICFFWIVSWVMSRDSPCLVMTRYVCNPWPVMIPAWSCLRGMTPLGNWTELESFSREALDVNNFCSYWAKCHVTRLPGGAACCYFV